MGRLHTFVVTLRRESRDTNWGLRLVGGADLATPLIVTRVRYDITTQSRNAGVNKPLESHTFHVNNRVFALLSLRKTELKSSRSRSFRANVRILKYQGN